AGKSHGADPAGDFEAAEFEQRAAVKIEVSFVDFASGFTAGAPAQEGNFAKEDIAKGCGQTKAHTGADGLSEQGIVGDFAFHEQGKAFAHGFDFVLFEAAFFFGALG